MNRPVRWLLLGLLAMHAAVTARALMELGYLDLFRWAFSSWPTFQIFSDLTVCMVLISSWMLRDARQSGRSAWPYLALGLAAGSFGPLLYLLIGELRRARPGPAAATIAP